MHTVPHHIGTLRACGATESINTDAQGAKLQPMTVSAYPVDCAFVTY